MSLDRFEAPSARDDARFNLVLDEDAREYLRELAPVDRPAWPQMCPETHNGLRCHFTAGHYPKLSHACGSYADGTVEFWRDDVECSRCRRLVPEEEAVQGQGDLWPRWFCKTCGEVVNAR